MIILLASLDQTLFQKDRIFSFVCGCVACWDLVSLLFWVIYFFPKIINKLKEYENVYEISNNLSPLAYRYSLDFILFVFIYHKAGCNWFLWPRNVSSYASPFSTTNSIRFSMDVGNCMHLLLSSGLLLSEKTTENSLKILFVKLTTT